MNYYRRYVGDYLRDTARLSMLEHGAYNLLLDYYYADEKPLPLDRDELYLMVRAMSSGDRKAVDKILRLYFTEQTDGFHQKRVDHEISVSQKARENGSGGGRPPKPNGGAEETGTITGMQTGLKPDSKPDRKPLNATGSITETITGSGHPPTTNHQPPASNPQPPTGSDAANNAASVRRPKRNGEAKSAAIRGAYCEAYRQRYGANPVVDNAKSNALLCQVIDRLGADEAPEVAAFYVRHNGSWYVKNMHQLDWLVRDAEKLRTEWATGTAMTDTRARQADKTQANRDVWGKLIAESEEQERTLNHEQ